MKKIVPAPPKDEKSTRKAMEETIRALKEIYKELDRLEKDKQDVV